MGLENVIMHNMNAMFTERQLKVTSGNKAKSTQKLSSGYKINSAADDAAGLSISEKMRRQIRGLSQAQDNVQDGISFSQTADGYLNEVTDMLQRCNQLAVKGANGTLTADDRENIDQEVQQLKGEIRNILHDASFNEIRYWRMPYVPEVEGPVTDIQVFNSAMSPSGEAEFGGVEINDVRYTWDELGFEVSADGKTFAENGSYEQLDYTGERIALSVKKGDTLDQVTRNYSWDADNRGIIINNKLAATWEDIGISAQGNYGKYSFDYHGMNISFDIENSASLQDVIAGIHGDSGTRAVVNWDFSTSYHERSMAVDITPGSELEITDANKYIADDTYTIHADGSGIRFTNSSNVSSNASTGDVYDTSNSLSDAHKLMKWDQGNDDFQNIDPGEDPYPIVDWGLSDYPNDATGITFDDTATYEYLDDSGNAAIPEFSFTYTLQDEASLEAVINGINGVSDMPLIYSPCTMTAQNASGTEVTLSVGNQDSHSAAANPDTNRNTAISGQIYGLSNNFLLQRAYRRTFDVPTSSIGGSFTRTLVAGDQGINWQTSEYVNSFEKTGSALAGTSNTSTVYFKEGDTYRAYTKTEAQYKANVDASLRNTWTDNYSFDYNGWFFESTETMDQQHGQTVGLRYERIDGVKYDCNILNTQYTATETTVSLGDLPTGAVVVDSIAEKSRIIEGTEYAGTRQVTVAEKKPKTLTNGSYTFSDDVVVSTAKSKLFASGTSAGHSAGAAFDFYATSDYATVDNLVKTNNYSAVDIGSLSFKGAATATMSLSPQERLTGNVNDHTVLNEVYVHTPMKRLDIQAGAEAGQHIVMEWSPLNLAIFGISGMNTLTAESSDAAIRQMKGAIEKVSSERSRFGAYVNRMEHTTKNLANITENTTAAESLIRDTDVALEMVEFSRHNILEQAGTSMLSQANQSRQNILSLLG